MYSMEVVSEVDLVCLEGRLEEELLKQWEAYLSSSGFVQHFTGSGQCS